MQVQAFPHLVEPQNDNRIFHVLKHLQGTLAELPKQKLLSCYSNAAKIPIDLSYLQNKNAQDIDGSAIFNISHNHPGYDQKQVPNKIEPKVRVYTGCNNVEQHQIE